MNDVQRAATMAIVAISHESDQIVGKFTKRNAWRKSAAVKEFRAELLRNLGQHFSNDPNFDLQQYIKDVKRFGYWVKEEGED